jgi:TolB-like protein/tetratricopeptide (TPR) repeat protein/DNA-binding winged helix-turn-helix (wHTH) protein
MVMDATDLEEGFRLGDWVVEPRLGRVTGHGRSHPLDAHQGRILQVLAARHGEVVDRQVLCDEAWPQEGATDEMLRATVRSLRRLLGDTRDNPRYIAKVAGRGYALIAHFEPLEMPGAAIKAIDPAAVGVGSPWVANAQKLISELQRRSVFKVLSAYLVGMFIVLQVAQTTFQPLHFPDWWLTALTILAVIGIPIMGMLAWSYEITPTGIVLDSGDTARVPRPKARKAIAPWLVAGVALMAGVTGLAWWRSIEETSGPAPQAAELDQRSVAVLPLVDMTSGGQSGYLGDGFAEEISAQLAQIPGLRVAARTSAFEFKGQSVDVRKIGAALGVRNVLEGSVRRDKDKLRVTVQLIDTVSGYHLWSGTYDSDWADVIAIQDNISRSITKALEVVLTPEAERRLKREVVPDLAAYDLYLSGTSALRAAGTLSELDKAGGLFREAIQLDPGLARAYAGLCEVNLQRYNRTRATVDVTAAEESCRKALELEPSRAETEMALGKLYLASGRHEQAEAVYSRLAASRPRDADAQMGLAEAVEDQGRVEDAERWYRKAIAVEPGYWRAHNALGGFLFRAGRAGESVAEYGKSAELAPGNASPLNNLGAALMMDERLDEAARVFEKSLAIEPTRSAHSNLGTLYYYQRRFPEAVSQYESAQALASDDHTVVSALADALWQVPGRRPDAVQLYQKACGLAESALKIDPTEAAAWAALAYYSGRAGNPQAAARALARAELLGDKDMYAQMYIALTLADRNDREAAIEAIARALELGYSRKLLLADPQLGPMAPKRS